MAHLLDSIKNRLGIEEDDEGYSDTFEDMHYVVGQTTGKDVGQTSNVLSERIGRFAQLGGSTLEILIDNPATFQVDREELMSTIDGLGVDTSYHGSTGVGYTSAYATAGGGYNITHRYFTRYLHQLAYFKKSVENSERFNFGIDYVNMHASTSQLPPLEERLAQDKSLDPFGKSMENVNGNKSPNIYKNKDFMEKLYESFVKEEIDVYQHFSRFFINYSKKFEQAWKVERNKVIDEFFFSGAISDEARAAMLESAGRIDRGAEVKWEELLYDEIDKGLIDAVNKLLGTSNMTSLDMFQSFSKAFHRLRELDPDEEKEIRTRAGIDQKSLNEILEGTDWDKEDLIEKIDSLIRKFWKGLQEEDESDVGLSFQSKLKAADQNRDFNTNKLPERAYNESDVIDDLAKKVFSGQEEMWEDEEYEEQGTPKYLILWEKLITDRGPLAQHINKESSIFYTIMPAWLSEADKDFGDDHPGWESAKFIWDNIVEQGREDVNPGDSDWMDDLSNDRELRLDVVAAVGSAYLWGHFTQREAEFDTEKEGDYNKDIKPGLEGGSYYWVEWMNKYDFKTNIEAMYGDPGQLLRVWRPRDIAIACRAVNMTAKKMSEKESWRGGEYEGDPLKFTIDLEHTGSFGVDPEGEMEDLIESESRLADEHEDIDPDKPLADILKTYHLTKPGYEQSNLHRHGPFARGDTVLYRWLYTLVENGFARNDEEEAVVMFEIGGEYKEEIYVIRLALDMIQRGITPEELDPESIPLEGEYENTEQALMARFFGLDKAQFNSEMTKIEEHAFDPLDNLLEAEGFDYTYSSSGAMQNENRPGEWMQEEYR